MIRRIRTTRVDQCRHAGEISRAHSHAGRSWHERAAKAGVALIAVLATYAAPAARAADQVNGNLILFNDNGAWCWYQDERAIVDPQAGKLLLNSVAASRPGVNGPRDGHVDLTTFDLNTGARTLFVLGQIQEDDHNVAALLKRPDGRYLAVYTNHGTDRVTRYRVSVNPEDTREWTPERQFDWRPTPGNNFNVTYSNLFYLKAEDKVYNFVRANDRSPNMLLSTDQGETWTYGGQLTRSENVGYVNGYFKYASNGIDRIHFIATEAHPRDYNNGIYHAYIEKGKLLGSDGSTIDENVHDSKDIPPTVALTPVFKPDAEDGSQKRNRAWTTDIALDAAGLPYALFTTRAGDARPSADGTGDDRRLYYARYDGKKWAYHEVAKMGRRLFRSEQDYTGLGALVPGDPNTIYISTPIHPGTQAETPHHEIYKGVTNNGGQHWDWVAITQESSVDNLRPIVPQWEGNNLALLWFRGRMFRSQAYDFAVVGIVNRQGQSVEKVRYVDANAKNTILANEPQAASSAQNADAAENSARWQERSGIGNNGNVWAAPASGTDGTNVLKTQLADLKNGTYELFVYFWGKTGEDTRVAAGLSAETMLSFRQVHCQIAEPSQFLADQNVSITGDANTLYRAYVGRVRIKDGESVSVFVRGDNASAGESQTLYDGIGYARVVE